MGGIQVILCGDFYQLAPVDATAGFAFEAACWTKLISSRYHWLDTIFRQEDNDFVRHLNLLRVGSAPSEVTTTMLAGASQVHWLSIPAPTRLPACPPARAPEADG